MSGGQTGVDRAALDVAMQLRIDVGGWCPKGRLAEDGLIALHYPLIETPSAEYAERTCFNIRDSDGTLIIVPALPLSVTDGTVLTIDEVKRINKPYYILDASKNCIPSELVAWAVQNKIRTLNIAGPRESQSPGIYLLSSKILKTLMLDFANTTVHKNKSKL